ncbi:MAG: hypothetical protein WHU10_02135, partial [Fimbriimonadales bacterium]
MKRSNLWRLLVGLLVAGCSSEPKVGELQDGSMVVPTLQTIRPAGIVLELKGRPVDLEPLGDSLVAVLDNRGLLLVDTASWKVLAEAPLRGGTSQIGLAWDPSRKRLFASTAGSEIAVASIDGTTIRLEDPIRLPAAPVGGAAYPTGLAWNGSTGTLLACLSRSNQLAEVDPTTKELRRTVEVGVAPFDVCVLPGGSEALVACWSDWPADGSKRADSSGTSVEVDERGIGTGGVLCKVDLREFRLTGKLPLPRQPSEIALSCRPERARS